MRIGSIGFGKIGKQQFHFNWQKRGFVLSGALFYYLNFISMRIIIMINFPTFDALKKLHSVTLII